MKRVLTKALIVLLLTFVAHDFFVKQCDVMHSKRADIIAQHVDHQIFHQHFIKQETPRIEPPLEREHIHTAPRSISSQIHLDVSTPPPRA